MTKISVVAVFFEMRREAARTLYTLSPAYQRNCQDIDYEVIAVDNGSRAEPLTDEFVSSFGPGFRLVKQPRDTKSPAIACNMGAQLARSDKLLFLIDGARMMSPGVLHYAGRAFCCFCNPFVHTIALHIGPEPQNYSLAKGYDQQTEDQLLDGVDWRANGYALFDVSSLALSSRGGFFSSISESNCVAVQRDTYFKLGGFDERFESPGGGLVNLDFFNRFMEAEGVQAVRLLGEASFHQFHGGVATNVPMTAHPAPQFAEEYRRIRGRDYRLAARNVHYIGHLPRECMRFLMPRSQGRS